ncbi:MAG: hypothetical protein IJR96_07380 [Pseudobutyrivibrio sp.]|nr:hypothetical protein [Pseudobutyrivibrio sp.]
MRGFFGGLKFFIGTHKVASIATASVLGLSALGAGGYGIYNALASEEQPEEEVIQEAEVVEEVAAVEDVYIPEFKHVVLSSESLEKDLTIYISDNEDNAVTGVPFQVKLIDPKNAETLNSYVDAINDINTQIAEATAPYEGQDVISILRDRNVDVEVTDENGEVVETQRGDVKSDPLYLLYLDKETAIQSFAMALKEVEGTVYTDDEEDGVLTEKEMTPGDYVACLMYDFDEGPIYDPTEYLTTVNVKDKVEFKVQKEITKQIKKDVASEDQQPKAAAPVEEVPTDTVEFVASSKTENGSSAKSISGADITAPKSVAKSSKATRKDGGKTSVTHEVKVAAKEHTITVKDVFCNEDGSKEEKTETRATEKKAVGATYEYGPKTGLDGYECFSESSNKKGTVAETDIEVVFKYKKVKTAAEKKAEEDAKKAEEEKKAKEAEEKAAKEKADQEAKEKAEKEAKEKEEAEQKAKEEADKKAKEEADKKAKEDAEKQNQQEQQEQPKQEETKSNEGGSNEGGETPAENSTTSLRIKSNRPMAIALNTQSRWFAAKIRKVAANTTNTEKATLDMSYSGGTFTISASSNVGSVKVNGADIALNNGKGTYTVTQDGEYKLTGVATFSDNYKDESLAVVYVVSGYGAATTDRLKDKDGHELFLDEGLTKPATAADYAKDKTFYYKSATYAYYGWQSIDGATYFFDKNGNKVTGTQVIQGVKYDFGPDGALLVKGTGIDVSKYQGNIDWNQAKSAVGFAIIRCGYRGQNDGLLHEDPYFYKNMKGAKAAGVATGIYIFSRALNEAEAVQEASMAVAMAQKAGGCAYPIYLDMEDTTRGQSRLSNAERTAIVNAFVSTVQSSGYKAGLYCSKNWMTSKMDAGSISCHVWIAQYNTTCTYSGKYTMWQYSSKGSVPGIKGNVDMNRSYF